MKAATAVLVCALRNTVNVDKLPDFLLIRLPILLVVLVGITLTPRGAYGFILSCCGLSDPRIQSTET